MDLSIPPQNAVLMEGTLLYTQLMHYPESSCTVQFMNFENGLRRLHDLGGTIGPAYATIVWIFSDEIVPDTETHLNYVTTRKKGRSVSENFRKSMMIVVSESWSLHPEA